MSAPTTTVGNADTTETSALLLGRTLISVDAVHRQLGPPGYRMTAGTTLRDVRDALAAGRSIT